MVTLQNSKGEFIKPSLAAASKAAQVTIPADTRISLTNSAASGSYPLTSFTWLITYQDLDEGRISKDKAVNLVDLFWWMTHDGQRYATEMGYSALAPEAVKKTETLLHSLTYKGKSILEPDPANAN
jgi:phosphate transport system substrate-binding protein